MICEELWGRKCCETKREGKVKFGLLTVNTTENNVNIYHIKFMRNKVSRLAL
jgi:hypothetical protein